MSLGPAFDAKEQVRQAIDIVDLVGSYIPLRRQGRIFVGLCPFHDDSKPSLQVNPDRQSWKCWVCGDRGGDIFDWIQVKEGVEFREALEMLAERAGVELKASKATPVQPGSPNDKKTLYEAAAWAETQFHEYLLNSPDAEIARQYLEDRGITPNSVERFKVGFSANSWQWLSDRARTTKFSPEVLEAVGLSGRSESSGRYYDRFKGRVIFPIRDTQRRVIAFGGRVLPELAKQEAAERNREPAKYVNSPETRLYSKSDTLYALHLAVDATSREKDKKSRHLVVVEGYTDVIMAHQCGVNNVVAVCGTALNERHINLLRRYADLVTLVLDGDEAGQRRTNQILELFVAADIDLRILSLPQGLDPFDFLRDQGAGPFEELLDGARDALEHKVTTELQGVDVVRDTHRASQALDNILATVAQAPRLKSTTTTSARLREQQILSRLARTFRINESELRTRLNELRRKKESKPRKHAPSQQPLTRTSPGDPRECELLEILIAHPELIKTAATEVRPDWLSFSAERALFETFCQIHNSGELAIYDRVMTHLGDGRLKNLLIELDESARNKAQHVQTDAAIRLQDLIESFLESEREVERREHLAALDETTLNEQEQLDILNQLIEQKRNRQGISAPTDG